MKTPSFALRFAAAAGLALALPACSTTGGYERPRVTYNGTATLGPLQGIAQKIESGVNNPSAGIVGPVANIGRVDAQISTQRRNPVDLTPNFSASGSTTLGGRGGPRPTANDRLIAPRGSTPADVRMQTRACEEGNGVVFQSGGDLYCRL
ncbi:MAG: hypothetical protein AB7E85_09010 [Pseudobdellovibrionaceae bacterium]